MLYNFRIGLLLKNLILETSNIHKIRFYFEGITRMYKFYVALNMCGIYSYLLPLCPKRNQTNRKLKIKI